jgi:FtsH-binding integral membrane protein
MSNYETYGRPMPSADAQAIDQGLRTYMIGVYQFMALGIALTGAVALVLSMQPALMQAIFGTPLKWVALLAPVPVALYAQIRIHQLSPGTAQGLFWLYAALVGVTFSALFVIFTAESLVRVFFITAAAFLALSLYGYTTKRNLSGWGSFLFIGMIGIFFAAIANIFIESSALNFAVSAIGVLVFAGFTAYDTQQIREMYYQAADETTAARYSVLGALWLYISFVAMFQFLLNLIGDRE